MNLRVFDGLRAALAQQHRVTAIDLPDTARAPGLPAARRNSSWRTLAAVLPRAATLVGWSLGGQLALQLAARSGAGSATPGADRDQPALRARRDWPHGLPAATLRQFAAQLEHDAGNTVADFLELQVRGSADAAAVRADLAGPLRQHGAAQRRCAARRD